MCLKSIKLVTFDVTNTLLHFRVPPWEYYALVAQNHGFTGTSSELKPRLLESFNRKWKEHPNFGRDSIRWEEWWRQVVKDTFRDKLPTNSNLEGLSTTLIKDYTTTKCWRRTDGCDDLISLLKDHNIKIGLISNFDPRLHDILENIGLKNCFDFVVTSYDVGYLKPDCRIFQQAISMIKNVASLQALHIGDDIEKDYNGSRAAGWHGVLVADNVNSETPPAPEHVFKSIRELTLAIIQQKLKL